MRTVEDEAGQRYLLLKRTRSASLVRDLDSGERQHLPTEALTVVEDESPLASAAEGVPETARRLVTAIRDERTLGLLVALESAEELSARRLLEVEDYCETDLHGLMTELQSAGLVERTSEDGQEGYRLTEPAGAVVRALQSATVSG